MNFWRKFALSPQCSKTNFEFCFCLFLSRDKHYIGTKYTMRCCTWQKVDEKDFCPEEHCWKCPPIVSNLFPIVPLCSCDHSKRKKKEKKWAGLLGFFCLFFFQQFVACHHFVLCYLVLPSLFWDNSFYISFMNCWAGAILWFSMVFLFWMIHVIISFHNNDW